MGLWPTVIRRIANSEDTADAMQPAERQSYRDVAMNILRSLLAVWPPFGKTDEWSAGRLRPRAERRGSKSAERERAYRATSGSLDAVWEWDLLSGRLWFSPEWARLVKWPTAGAGGINPSEGGTAGGQTTEQGSAGASAPRSIPEWLGCIHDEDRSAVVAAIRRVEEDPGLGQLTVEYRLKASRLKHNARWILCRAYAKRDRSGRLIRLSGLQTDITHTRIIDPLTQFPNREYAVSYIDMLVERCERGEGEPFALFLINLNRFRVVNDSLGHALGDKVLRKVAVRLSRAVRAVDGHDLVARLHGDTFALVLHGVTGQKMAEAITERVAEQLWHPIEVGTQDLRLSASIGVALCHPGYCSNSTGLMRSAEIALQQAKAGGRRARYVLFDPAAPNGSVQRMERERELRGALQKRQFELFYQAKVEVSTGRLAGFEALLRWRHPHYGLVPPLEFIPLAEETELILPIGTWVLQESARQLAEWRSRFPGLDIGVAANVSPKQFFDRNLVEDVQESVRQWKLPHGTLCLEVTENVMIGEMRKATDILNKLKAAGVSLALDDFGTGYSSLHYLATLPFDGLKIDRSFVSRMLADGNCAEIVKMVVALGSTLNLEVVAEGVETVEQSECFEQIGCRYGQGFYYSKPVSANEATTLLEAMNVRNYLPA